jgi:hypothetical protein
LIVAVIVSILVLQGIGCWFAFSIWTHPLKEAEVRLLRDTDYYALLEACRELSQRAKELGLKPDYDYAVHTDPSPEAAKFPKVILEVNPAYVCIDGDGCLWVAIAGGLTHEGVRVYPLNHATAPASKLGDRELIPGLWYYDDGYEGNPFHRKRIDALIEEGKKRHHLSQTTDSDPNAVK